MKYLEIKIEIQAERVEQLLNELSIAGINDVIIDNPVEIADIVSNLGDTEWYDSEQVNEGALINSQPARDVEDASNAFDKLDANAHVTIYAADDEEGRERIGKIKECIESLRENATCFVEFTETIRDDSEWKDAWKEYYHTTQVSERFIVKPSWESLPENINDVPFIIEIDPGMAFGTGTHETTSLSLRLMEKYIEPGDSVLDVGTGSGILAIAAAKLGATDILGIDIDEDAVRVANENIEKNLNGCITDDPNISSAETAESSISVKAIVGDLTEGVDFVADVVVANLLADLVMKLTASVAKHMNKNAVYITSGILIEKQDEVIACLEENGFTIVEILEDGEWCAIAACIT